MHDLAVRAGALVLFLAILAGGVYAAEQAFGDATPGAHGTGAVQLSSPEASKTAAPGTMVTFPVVARNNGAEDLDVELQRVLGASPRVGSDKERLGNASVELQPVAGQPGFAAMRLKPGQSAGTFLTFQAPPTEGRAAAHVVAVAGGKVAAVLPVQLTVRTPAQPAAEGDQLQVDYVGRFVNGTLFDTSVRAVGEGPFPKPDPFRRDYQPIQLQLGGQAGTIEGFWRSMLGMAEGHSKTFVLPPELAYGNATIEQEVPRLQELARLSQSFERVQHFPRTVLAQYLNESSRVGDRVVIGDPSGNQRAYVITALDAANASLLWEVREGDPFTIYPIFPGQSRAFRITNESVVFRTTPDDPDAALSFYQFWPNATRARSMNETTIVLDTAPPPGTEFTVPSQGGAIQARVVRLTDTAIVVERPNAHPLAGQTLVFDVTVRQVQRGGV